MAERRRLLLTRQLVEQAKPEQKPYRIHDTKVPGLHLRVQPSGAKSWNLRWKADQTVSLGKFPAITLEMARERARRSLVEGDQHGAPLRLAEHQRVDRNATLADFIDRRFEQWAVTNQKAGAKNVAAVRSAFAGMLGLRLWEITAERIESWRTARAAGGAKPSTTNRDIVRMKGLLSRAVDWKVLTSHPLQRVKLAKVGKGVIRFLSPGEAVALRSALALRDDAARNARERANLFRRDRKYPALPAIPGDGFADHLTPLVLVALNTGLRRGELTALRWSDVDLSRKTLHVRYENSKSGEGRHVPLNAEAIFTLKQWRRQTNAERVFDIVDAKKAWAGVLAAAKITRFRFHDLRHDFASQLVMRGVSLYVVKELLGHASLRTTEAYAHLASSAKSAAVELLAN